MDRQRVERDSQMASLVALSALRVLDPIESMQLYAIIVGRGEKRHKALIENVPIANVDSARGVVHFETDEWLIDSGRRWIEGVLGGDRACCAMQGC